jgi:hypothetical protein
VRDPGNNYLKAWAKEYEEAPFFFSEKSDQGARRLVAWTEESTQTQQAFYAIIEKLPWELDLLLKICVGHGQKEKPLWARYHGLVNQSQLIHAIQENELYIFSDGMHQLCLKDPQSDRYLAFDDHGVFFLYSPLPEDVELFQSLGFNQRHAELIFSAPHFQCTPPDSDKLEKKFMTALKLKQVNSDLDT